MGLLESCYKKLLPVKMIKKVLESLNNHPDNEMATMWSIRFHIQNRKPNMPTLNAEVDLPNSSRKDARKMQILVRTEYFSMF